jgi:hypothetical protein
MGHWGTGSLEYWILKRTKRKQGIICKKYKDVKEKKGGGPGVYPGS